MTLLKALVKSTVTGPSEYYISAEQYYAGAELLTVYNGNGVPYGLLVKAENILKVTPQ